MKTNHEKIIRRENGTRVKITVRFVESKYITGIEICPFRKRKWIDPVDKNSFDYRHLSWPDRQKFIKNIELEYVSEDEVLTAKMELWEKMKPEMESI